MALENLLKSFHSDYDLATPITVKFEEGAVVDMLEGYIGYIELSDFLNQ